MVIFLLTTGIRNNAFCDSVPPFTHLRPTVLPIEVVGHDGATVSVSLDTMPLSRAAEVRSLHLIVHGLGFAGMASVRINNVPWIPLDNSTVQVAEPGKGFGGIGGGFSTLDLTVPLPSGSVRSDGNIVAFRFNQTDGVASGFRVLAFNLLTSGGDDILPADAFAQEDPNLWQPPLPDPSSAEEGKQFWYTATLLANGLRNAQPIKAHCADCHAQDGRDLKYFNFSNASIVARSQFHGLTESQGLKIASYIRSLAVPNPGRPWNPPFQPGPGLSHRRSSNWSAGAGLEWSLKEDSQALRYLFPGVGTIDSAITSDAFNPDGHLDPRDIPIAMQLPDWNHWLPRVHPMDAWGDGFASSDPQLAYQSLRQHLSGQDGVARAYQNEIPAAFDDWIAQRDNFLKPHLPAESAQWNAELTNKVYSTQLWQLVKTWEIMQEFSLESPAASSQDATAAPWPNTVPAATSPAAVGIPDGPAGMGGSALSNEYFTNAWYELQLQVDGADHGRDRASRNRWVYMIAKNLDLQQRTHFAEPGRVLVAAICAQQSTDPARGPKDPQGWQPDRNIDPRILVAPEWAETFTPLSAETRAAITESFLQAWLDKNKAYPIAAYFNRFLTERSYVPPPELVHITGGHVWEAAPLFEAKGVSPGLLQRLRNWGYQYTDMARRFQY